MAVPPEDLKALVDGNNRFAFDLYKKVAERTDGNVVLSPYSISTALAMTYAGARGETAEQMAKTLHFTLPPDRLHPAFGANIDGLNAVGAGPDIRLSVANALWGRQGVSFRPEFVDLVGRSYRGGLRELDFAGDRDRSRDTINRWVSEQTDGRIPELLERSHIQQGVFLVLTNAVYFRCD